MAEARFMLLAIREAAGGIAEGQAPFGSVIARRGKIIASAHNEVWESTDITAHAEIVAIRAACRRLRTVDLSGCEIYSTCEPCPMCFSAIHWAGISSIIYGAPIADARKCGFSELCISNATMKRLGKSKVGIKGGFMRGACAALFGAFLEKGGKRRLY
jgi:guanine deaminase